MVKRGEIWWACLESPRGSEPGYRRPVVVASANEFNQSLIQTVTVVVITSNLRLVDAPGNFKLSKKASSLAKDSVVNVSQLLTLDKQFLTEKAGCLNAKLQRDLDAGLKLALNL